MRHVHTTHDGIAKENRAIGKVLDRAFRNLMESSPSVKLLDPDKRSADATEQTASSEWSVDDRKRPQ